ncbi:MAG: hypothetical protein GX967_02675 [Clostridiales bacterium]|nr:hypothetical protein [Clostridiales bacterium]
MINIRLFKTSVKIDFSFLAVLLIFMLVDESGYGLMGLYACLIHEIGHLIAMVAVRLNPDEILFYGAGIRIKAFDEYKLSYGEEIFVLSFGSITNLLVFAVLYYNANGQGIGIFAVIHLLIGLFNLLPITIFDGGRMLELILMRSMRIGTASLISRIISAICTLAMLFAAISFYSLGKVNFTIVATLCYISVVTIIFPRWQKTGEKG